jgi:hypothetical protein
MPTLTLLSPGLPRWKDLPNQLQADLLNLFTRLLQQQRGLDDDRQEVANDIS